MLSRTLSTLFVYPLAVALLAAQTAQDPAAVARKPLDTSFVKDGRTLEAAGELAETLASLRELCSHMKGPAAKQVA
jgi:hypothetical protein